MQTAQAHPSIIYHRHPHDVRILSWEDGLLLAAVLTLTWVLWPFRNKGRKVHGMERDTRELALIEGIAGAHGIEQFAQAGALGGLERLDVARQISACGCVLAGCVVHVADR